MALVKPRAVLFDWDNTLVDTWPIIHEALYNTFTHFGREPWTLQQVRERVARSMRDAFPDVFGEGWQEAAKIYQANYRAIHLQKLKSLPGAEEVLKLLGGSGVHVGIVSNKTGENLRKEVPYLKWDSYFDVLVGSGDAEHDKPHAAPVLKALEGTNIEAGKDVWLIGDSLIDLECAEKCGIRAVLYGDINAQAFPVHARAPDHKGLSELIRSVL